MTMQIITDFSIILSGTSFLYILEIMTFPWPLIVAAITIIVNLNVVVNKPGHLSIEAKAINSYWLICIWKLSSYAVNAWNANTPLALMYKTSLSLVNYWHGKNYNWIPLLYRTVFTSSCLTYLYWVCDYRMH